MKLSSGAIETRRPPASLTSIIKTAATALALPFDPPGVPMLLPPRAPRSYPIKSPIASKHTDNARIRC